MNQSRRNKVSAAPASSPASPLGGATADTVDTVNGAVRGTVYIVEANEAVGQSVHASLEPLGGPTLRFRTAGELLGYYHSKLPGCLVVNVSLPDMSGMELQSRLLDRYCLLPLVFLGTGSSVAQAVRVIRKGAMDFLDIPFQPETLRNAVLAALKWHEQRRDQHADVADFAARLDQLTLREREVFDGIMNGKSNRAIGDELGVSEKTIETHRFRLTTKLQIKSLAEMVRMSLQLQALREGFQSATSRNPSPPGVPFT